MILTTILTTTLATTLTAFGVAAQLAKSARLALATLAVFFMAASVPAFAEVQVTIHDGLVSVVAKDATLRQILTEWARVGQAKVVNGERIPGGPISLELTNVPEQQALDVLLRSISGYIAAPRQTVAANLSRYDRLIVMPVSAVRAASGPPPPVFQQPQFPQSPLNQPGAAAMPTVPQVPDDADEERPQPNTSGPTPNPRGPVFQTFPQPQVVNPNQPLPTGGPYQPPSIQQQPVAPQPAPYPTAPFGGVAVPGMIVPSPPQGNQPGVINAPGQVNPQQPRRPGGVK